MTTVTMRSKGSSGRACAALAWSGALALVVGTVLHPAQAEPRDAVAAFAEYASDARWSWWLAHLLQLVGVVGLVLAVVWVAGELAREASGAGRLWWAAARALGVAGIAVAFTLQAVDGVALKALTDLWAASQDAGKPTLFAAALAVRQVEIGLDAVLALCLGGVLTAFGAGWLAVRVRPRALGVAALLAGAANLVAGVLEGLDGYSDAAMTATTVAGVAALAFTVALGVVSW